MNEPPSPEQTRRPGVAARPVILADGRPWGLASPSPRLVPVINSVDGEETISVRIEVGYSLEICNHLDSLRRALEERAAERQHQAFFRLAAALLMRVHEIPPATAAALLSVRVEEYPRLVEEVITIAIASEVPATKPTAEENGDARPE